MFRNNLAKNQFAALAPIIELEEPEERDNVLDMLQDIWDTSEGTSPRIEFAGIPDISEFSHGVRGMFGLLILSRV